MYEVIGLDYVLDTMFSDHFKLWIIIFKASDTPEPLAWPVTLSAANHHLKIIVSLVCLTLKHSVCANIEVNNIHKCNK